MREITRFFTSIFTEILPLREISNVFTFVNVKAKVFFQLVFLFIARFWVASYSRKNLKDIFVFQISFTAALKCLAGKFENILAIGSSQPSKNTYNTVAILVFRSISLSYLWKFLRFHEFWLFTTAAAAQNAVSWVTSISTALPVNKDISQKAKKVTKVSFISFGKKLPLNNAETS